MPLGTSGEASREQLANSDPHGSGGPLEPTKRKHKGRKRTKIDGEICRATCRLRIEPRKLVRDHRRESCGGPATCDACYLESALREARDLVTRASNVAMREAYRRESDWLDAWIAEHGEPPGKREGNWLLIDKPDVYPYAIIRRAAPTLASSIATALGERVRADWRNWRWDILIRETRSPAHYRNAAIPIPAQVFELRHVSGDDYTFTFRLHSEEVEHGRRLRLPIKAHDENQRLVLSQIASGNWRKGGATIQEDGQRPGRWYLRIAYKRVIERVARSERVAAVNRGLGCFFAVVTHTGEDWIYDGYDIIAHLAQMQARRRQYQNQLRASNRDGHGRARALRPTERLREIARRWRHDKIHVLARRLGEWLSERDICRLYLEDFTAIRVNAHERLGERVGQLVQEWPYYLLQQVITSVLQELGIEVMPVPSRDEDGNGIAETCVACGHVSRESMDFRRRRFCCVACNFTRHLDVATSMNVLVRGERLSGGASAEVARNPSFLRSRAALRGPSTERVMRLPEVSRGGEGTARKSRRKSKQ